MGLVSELRRRNVLRMAVLYMVAAWLIMQVAEVVIALAGLPALVGPLVLVVLAIGFPIALAFAWFYEITPEGIALEKDVARGDSITPATGRRMDFVVISLLAAALVVFAFHTWWPSAPVDRSVAVLAFENMSNDPAQEYFSDGIAEELLNTLTKVSDLRVISRSSSFSFKGKDLDIPTIAKRLNVAHVLEGSVRKMGDSVRITAQLVDASTDAHLWSETYDRELTTQNIFAVQSEIAAAIADKLRATLTEQDQADLRKVPTLSLEAYQSYLLGRQRMVDRSSASLEKASAYFLDAVEHDPDFALAYVALAETYMLLGDYAGMSLNEVLVKSEPAIAAAIKLDGELAQAYVARGAVRSKAGDLGSAIVAFERAIELDPNYAKAYHWYADVLLNRRQEPDTALALLEKAYTLDPVSPALIVTMGQALSMLGRFDEALAYYQEAMDIEPAYASSYYLMGELHAFVHGRLDLGVRWGMEAAAIDPRYVTNLQALGIYYLALGDDGQAEYWINRALEAGPDRFRANRAAGFLYYQRGDDAKVREVARRLEAIAPGNNATLYLLVALADYREVLRYAAADHPELACDREPDIGRVNLMPAINISLALEESGDADCANRLLDGALDRMQSIPRLGVLGYGFADAEIHARQGRPELALAALRQAVEEGCCVFWWSQAERSPHTTSLRDDPRFIVIMNTIRDEMAGQLASVREMGLARDSAREVEMEAAIIEGAE